MGSIRVQMLEDFSMKWAGSAGWRGGLCGLALWAGALNVFAQGNSWETRAPMPVPRDSAMAGQINGLLYVVGGSDGTDITALQAYDPVGNSWTNLAPLPNLGDGGNPGRYQGAAGVIDGQLYVAGGWRRNPPLPTSSLQVYDPVANRWITKASLPTLSGCSVAEVINRKLYVMTPCDGNSGYRQFFHMYDPDSDTWTNRAPIPRIHANAAAAVLNGKLFVIGGNDGSVPTAAVDVYDPIFNTWSNGVPLPGVRQSPAAGVINGRIYVVGGHNGTNPVSTVFEFDPAAGTWALKAPMPTARHSLVAGVISGKLFAAGGGSTNSLATLEVYTANAGPTVALTAPANGAAFNPSANITIFASALDTDGTVVRVDFFAGIALIGSVTNLPYSIVWSNPPAGTYRLTARATDNAGATGYSDDVVVTVNPPGSVQLVNANFFGGPGDRRGTAVRIAGGGLFLAGITSANDGDALVARYSLPVGLGAAPVWSASWPGLNGGDHMNGVAVTGEGVYLAGDSYNRTTDSVGGKENKGVVVKFPLAGATGAGFAGAIWDRQTPAPPGAFSYGGGEGLNAITVAVEAPQFYLYATGNGQNGFANGGRLYLSKVAADSTVLWTVTDAANQVGSAYSSGRAVTVLNGNIYVAGRNDDSGSSKTYLRKYDSSGTLVWSRTSASGQFNALTALAGAIYAAGSASPLSVSSPDFLVEKWSESGESVWQRTFDRGSAEDILNGVVGLGSRVYAVGSTRGATAGGADAILLEIDPANGDLLSSTLYGGVQDDSANGVATDGTDLYVVGEARSFGGGTEAILLRYAVSQPAASLTVATAVLPNGAANQSYSAQFQAVGGTPPYTWSLPVTNSLPSGLILSTNGTIQGTPTIAGVFSFTVQVRDALGQTTNKAFSITIAAGSSVQLHTALFLGGTTNERATGISIAGGAVFVSGITPDDAADGLVARYEVPTQAGLAPTWTTAWPGRSHGDHFYGVAAATDGIYLAGDSYDRTVDTLGGKESKGIVVKFPLAGAIGTGFGGVIWERQTPAPPGAFGYGGSESLNAVAVVVEETNTFIYVTGNGQSGYANGGRLFLSKLRADSTIVWTVTDAGTIANLAGAYSSGRAVASLSGFVYVAGRTDDGGAPATYLRKYDAGGRLIWTRTSGSGQFNSVMAFGGAIYAVGSANATGGTDADFLVQKWDEAGNLQWSQQFDRGRDEDILNGIVGLGNRVYAVGSTRSVTAGGADAIVLELDLETGDLLSSTLYGGSADDAANGAATDGKDLYVAGETRSFGNGGNDAVLLRFLVTQPNVPLAVVTSRLDSGQAGRSYTALLQAFGGTPPYVWSLAAGSGPLPGGLALGTNGLIAGTPTNGGLFSLTVQVTDAAAPTPATATRDLSLVITLPNTPPSVMLVSPTNGGVFTAPVDLTLIAQATDSDGIVQVDFYAGADLVGTATNTPYDLTLTNVGAGSYSFKAVATDALGAASVSDGVNITVNSGVNTKLVNFDPLDAGTNAVSGSVLANYLDGFGITISGVTVGSRLVVLNDANIYGGQATVASTRSNLFTQAGINDPVSFTLNFSQSLAGFSFTRPALLAGASGITHPSWQARAFDAGGSELGRLGEDLISSFSNVPAKTFTLVGPGITSVRFDSDNRHFAAFSAVLLDDLLLETAASPVNLSPTVSLTGPTNGATFTAPATVTVSADAADSDGIREVEFYVGASTFVGSAETPPYSVTLSNLASGSYTVRAVAVDNLKATRTSAAVQFTVNPGAGISVVNFDTLNAAAGNVGGAALSNYLAGFGLTLTNVSVGTRLEVIADNNLYGGAAAVPSSLHNLLTQVGLNEPVSFTVRFAAPQESFRFTRPRLLAGPSGITHPQWHARAFDAAGREIGSVEEPLTASFVDVPSQTFTLTGPGIVTVQFDSDGRRFAAFSAVLLDDLVVSTNGTVSPLSVSITSPTNGAIFTGPVDIVVSASATTANSAIRKVEFFLGSTLVGADTGPPFSLTLSNVPPGDYTLTARAVDDSGLARVSSPVGFTVTAGSGGLTIINFDALNASGGEVTGSALANYLAGFGVVATNLTAGTRLVVQDQDNIYGGGAVAAASPDNILTQAGSNDPVDFTLRFAQLLESLQFTRPKLIAGPSGITHPSWHARAFDAAGVELSTVSEDLIASYTDVPARTFRLTGPGVASVRFESENRHFAAFSAVLLDDLVLAVTGSNNPPTVAITSPANGAAFAFAANVQVTVDVRDTDGTVSRVDYYLGATTLVATATSAPFSVTLSNLAAGAYTLRAVATDNAGAGRSSLPLRFTVAASVFTPSISLQPRSQRAATGTDVAFLVKTDGQEPLFYQWLFNGGILSGQTTATLIIANVQAGNAGNYRIVVSNNFGVVVSDVAALSVFDPPVIVFQPVGQTITVSNSATFSVTAVGAPPLFYQWRRNGGNLLDATNATLTIANARLEDSGNYQVVVANVVGAANSDRANLVVLSADVASGGADNFNDRVTINPLLGRIIGNNVSATKESGEPDHAGKGGGKSVWYTWTAPFSGTMAFSTRGSGFDTLLAVYNGTNLNNLTLVAADDDGDDSLTSLVTFNAVEGTQYQIAVDGFNGASGNIVLGLPSGGYRVLAAAGTVEQVPQIISQPVSQTVNAGGTVALNVAALSGTPLTYQWFYNNSPIQGANGASLTLSNFQAASVGRYTVLAVNSAGAERSRPAFLQINLTDASRVEAVRTEDKFADTTLALTSPLVPQGIQLAGRKLGRPNPHSAPARGYTGTQIFSTFGANKEEGEPNHCGIPGGASQWFSYQAETNGTLNVNTDGSDYDTVLAIYTGPGDSFETLVEAACDNDSGLDGQNSSVKFTCSGGTIYWIAVDGVNAAQGNVVLNWNLSAPPVITEQPQNQSVAAGGSAAFSVSVTGTAPIGYRWQFNGTNLPAGTNATLTLNNVQPTDAGNYAVVITNAGGTVTSVAATLTVNAPPIITQQPSSRTVAAGGNVTLTVAASGAPAPGYQWQLNGGNLAGATSATLTVTNFQAANQGNYRVVVSNAGGSVTSTTAELLLDSPMRLGSFSVSNGVFNLRLMGQGNSNYIIQGSSTLTNWVSLSTNSAANGLIIFTDTSAPNLHHRFYRARLEP